MFPHPDANLRVGHPHTLQKQRCKLVEAGVGHAGVFVGIVGGEAEE